MSEEIKRKAKELANKAYWRTKPDAVSLYEISDPNVEEILQEAMLWATQELRRENAELKARLWGQEPKEELVKCSACATISNWNKLTCGCPKCGNHSFYDVDKPKPQGEE